ncbi:protein of unknown function [Polaromonas sp. OV174]|uniref:DUF4148 domain-containing protein n=1 Tax=Polaromonas sp. OV174 TaxID=1855300 RepID=UPI0008EB35DC|nr:DUF4148 domain-containing protein [Polaromonas sp. OV174]SFC68360.1 protein of unknown function [Polaromonas sp. OV174]
MKSNFITAAVIAVAALTSVAASADTYDKYLFDQVQATSTKTRAEVNAELVQAQRQGYTLSSRNPFPPANTQAVASKTRAEVRAEVTPSSIAGASAFERNYPVIVQ